jgi:hypothetical protein
MCLIGGWRVYLIGRVFAKHAWLWVQSQALPTKETGREGRKRRGRWEGGREEERETDFDKTERINLYEVLTLERVNMKYFCLMRQ